MCYGCNAVLVCARGVMLYLYMVWVQWLLVCGRGVMLYYSYSIVTDIREDQIIKLASVCVDRIVWPLVQNITGSWSRCANM